MRGNHAAIDISREFLPEDFVPTESDVICGRGRTIDHHPGNLRFRKIIKQHEHSYVSAQRKLDKTILISNIVLSMKNGPCPCRFVDKDDDTGRWYEISTLMVKDKVAQAMRTCVRSSMGILNISKKQKALKKRQLKHELIMRKNKPGSELYTNNEGKKQEMIHGMTRSAKAPTASLLAEMIKTDQANLLSAAVKRTLVLPYLVEPFGPIQRQSNVILPCYDSIDKQQQQQINHKLQLRNEIEQLKREREELLTSIVNTNAIQQQQQQQKREMQRRLLLNQRMELFAALTTGRNDSSALLDPLAGYYSTTGLM